MKLFGTFSQFREILVNFRNFFEIFLKYFYGQKFPKFWAMCAAFGTEFP